MPDRLAGILGLCRRAGRLELGHDAVTDAVGTGKAVLVLIAETCSERTSGGIRKLAEEHHIEIRRLSMDMDEIGHALSKRVGVLAVCDKGFAEKIKELLDGAQSAKTGEELHRC